MAKINIKYAIGSIAAGLILWAGCGEPPTGHAGGGSDRPNPPAITGTVKYDIDVTEPSTQPVEIALYTVVADDTSGYSWYPTQVVYADSSGDFEVDSLKAGWYFIIAHDVDNHMAVANFRILSVGAVTSMALDTITLMPDINVRGTLSDSTGRLAQDVTLCLIGTPYCDTISLGDSGSFAFSGVPCGNYKMVITAFALNDSVMDLADSATVISVLDTLRVNPSIVYSVKSHITLTVDSWVVDNIAALDTSFTAGNQELPALPQNQTDSVKVHNGRIEVRNSKYLINYTVEENP